MIKIESHKLSKSYGDFQALKDLSLKFENQQIHAVVGENGAGKSTLMKILFGLVQPTSGSIEINGKAVQFKNSRDAINAQIGMVQQHFCLVENLSAIDNILLGNEPTKGLRINRDQALKDLIAKLPDESLHVPWHENVSELSVGFRQRVEILKLIYRDSQFLILDEPTAVLTPQEIQSFFALLKKLKEMGRTIVLVTHKLAEVFSVCDQYHILRQGELVATGLVAETTQNQMVKNMIGRELQSEDHLREPVVDHAVLKYVEVSSREQNRGRLTKVSLQVNAGEILGIAGVEGAGQSKLVESLMGLDAFDGKISFLGKDIESGVATQAVRDMGLALVPEDRHSQAIWLEESCSKNLIIGIEDQFERAYLFDESKISQASATWFKEFDVRLSDSDQAISSLSGGNQQKIVFAREVLGRKPKFIICHQPTRGVDLGAIEKIHSEILRLKRAGVSCLLISSELEELMTLSDRICVLFEGAITGEFLRSSFSKSEIGKAMTGVIN